MAGTDIKYNRTRYRETITAEGPLEQDLEVLVGLFECLGEGG